MNKWTLVNVLVCVALFCQLSTLAQAYEDSDYFSAGLTDGGDDDHEPQEINTSKFGISDELEEADSEERNHVEQYKLHRKKHLPTKRPLNQLKKRSKGVKRCGRRPGEKKVSCYKIAYGDYSVDKIPVEDHERCENRALERDCYNTITGEIYTKSWDYSKERVRITPFSGGSSSKSTRRPSKKEAHSEKKNHAEQYKLHRKKPKPTKRPLNPVQDPRSAVTRCMTSHRDNKVHCHKISFGL